MECSPRQEDVHTQGPHRCVEEVSEAHCPCVSETDYSNPSIGKSHRVIPPGTYRFFAESEVRVVSDVCHERAA